MPIPAPYAPPQPPQPLGSVGGVGPVVSWNNLVRSTGRSQAGLAAQWRRGVGLAVLVENTMDQAVTIELHGALTSDAVRELARPLWVFSVGGGQRVVESPDMGWVPWVFPMPYCPGGLPKSGNLAITFGGGA